MAKCMKRIIVLLIVLMGLFTILANDLSFEVFAESPLFEDIKFDPFSMSSSIRYMFFLDENEAPTTIRGTKYALNDDQNGEYTDVRFYDKPKNSYLKMKLGTNLGLFRFSFNKVKLEVNLQGGFNTIFNLVGASTAFGFDGTFQVGVNLSFYDKIAVTFGIHHFSGHLGDELLSRVQEFIDKDASFDGYGFYPIEYVRDNLYTLGLSVKPIKHIRLYSLVYLPVVKSWLRPYVHVPEYVRSPVLEESLQQRTQNDEHVKDSYNESTMVYDASYKAWEIQTGVEVNFDLLDFGQVYVVGDLKFHQDGQTKHMLGQYNPNNPWEMDTIVGLGVSVNKTNGGHLGFEVSYHDARMPLLNMFYNRGRFLSIGVNIIE